jgi:hypothetical protein
MHIARQITAGAGALMACALITLISMMQSQWVKDHPTGAQRLGIALLIGSVACFIFWMATREKQQGTAIKNKGNFVSRGNSARMIQAGVVNYHEAPVSPIVVQPSRPEPIPRISFLGPRKIWVKMNGQRYQEGGPGSTLGAVIEIANELAREGEPESPPVREIAAQLFFCDAGGHSGRVDRAFWLDRYENTVDLDSGESKAIVLGFFKDDLWLYCWNTRRDLPVYYTSTAAKVRYLAELSRRPITDCRILPLTIQSCLIVEITLFRASNGTTIATKSYVIRRINGAEQFSIEESK